jgi:hypothetical protein
MFETYQAALARAKSHAKGDKLLTTDMPVGDPTPYSVFFLYMRLNSNGTFEARQYYHEGNATDAIDPSPIYDPLNKTLGYYIKEMAIIARKESIPPYATGVEIYFPPRFSYCVFFMDDLYWRFLTEAGAGGQLPIISFKKEKNGKTFKVHDYAFRRLPLVEMEMPNRFTTAGVDTRQAAVMVNRMHNEHGNPLGEKEQEEFSFDFSMRVRFGSSSDGLTLIIDPTGTNLGPPEPPPPL